MASPGRDGEGSGFPAVDVDRELYPGHNKHVQVDPISSEVAASLQATEQAKIKEAKEEKRQEAKKKEGIQTLKTTFIISGIIAAVAVAAFAIIKNLK